jgi:GTPase SAR1 family protein
MDEAKLMLSSPTGVGKTSLVHLLSHNTVLSDTEWTLGANLEVMVCVIMMRLCVVMMTLCVAIMID